MNEQAWRQWLKAATTPRLLGVLVILVIGAVICVWLGMWQWERAQARGEQSAAVEQAEREDAPPRELTDVVAPQTQIVQEMVGQRVRFDGEYQQADQFFVVGREHDGQMGYWVLTALHLTGGEHEGARVPVVRGWTPVADPRLFEDIPEGPVQVLAFLAPPEGASARLPEENLLDAVSPAQLVNEWGGPIYSAQLRLISQEPAGDSGLLPVGPPEIEDAGLNLRNLAYAFEWWIFGVFALFLWWRLVRDEVRHRRAEASESESESESEPEPEPEPEPDRDRPPSSKPVADLSA